MYYVYMVRCCDGSYYTGYSTHPEERVKTHNAGKGAKYTRAKRPVELVYLEVYEDKQTALKREYALKQVSHQEKEKLVKKQAKTGRAKG